MQRELRILWCSLSSPLNVIPDKQGDCIYDGMIRYVQNNVWLYVDNIAGYLLMTDNEAASLGINLER